MGYVCMFFFFLFVRTDDNLQRVVLIKQARVDGHSNVVHTPHYYENGCCVLGTETKNCCVVLPTRIQEKQHADSVILSFTDDHTHLLSV